MRFLLAMMVLGGAALAQTTAGEAAKPEQTAAQTPAPADQKAAPADAKAAASPAPATDEWIAGYVDFGYRWVTDIGGNFPEYRSVVNLGDGPKLFGLDLTLQDPKHRAFDRLDLRALGWGGDPYNTAHVGARKQGVYDFRFDYQNLAYFNAVPSFANPFAPAGFDQQSFDIHRRNADFSLDLRPGKRIVPYLAFDRNSGFGNGIGTWVQEANNAFAVPTMLRDSTNNYRGGVRLEYNRFHITLEQGGTTYKNDDQSYFNGVNTGDRTTPVLGQNDVLYGLVQAYGIRGHGIYSKVLATGSLGSKMNFFGQFLFSEPKTDVHFTDLAYGNFVALSSLLFYSGQQTLGTGAANAPHTTANLGWEGRLLRRLRVDYSWMTDRYHDAASPLMTEVLFLNATTAGQPITTGLNYTQVVNYNQSQVDAFFDVTSKLTLRGGYRAVWGDATVLAGQLSQTGPTASGKLNRNVGLAGLNFRPSEKLSVNLDYEGASSDNVYFRTSLNDYNLARARARYQLNSALSLQANFKILNNQNPSPDIRYDFQTRANSLAIYWTPKGAKRVSVTGEYDRTTVRSDILYLGLFLAPGTSSYRENAHTASSAIDVALYRGAKVTAGGSLFISSGSRPTRYYQPMAKISIPFRKHLYWNTEWQYYGFGEEFYVYEGFRTHVFMTGLRVSR